MLVYLHGLNSSSRSHKAAVLSARLAPTPVRAPDYPAHRPDAAVKQLTDYFGALASDASHALAPVVVGSSMGGFYGQYLARRFTFAHLFLINPALTPWDLLGDYLSQSMTTANGERYEVTVTLAEETRPYGLRAPCRDNRTPTTLFLDTGDEVIDYRIAARLYRRCGRVHIFPGGDHAFQHLDEALPEIAVACHGAQPKADDPVVA